MKKALVYAKHKSARVSPKKMAAVMNMIRSKPSFEAKTILAFDRSKAAKMLLKVIRSAEANARNNLNIDPANLFVEDLRVNGGPVMKRGRFAPRGRFSPILKRTSHIIVGLSERGEK